MAGEILTDDFLKKEYAYVFSNKPDMDPVYFLLHYPKLMERYIANGRPSEDTKRSYFSAIRSYLYWCVTLHMDPLKATEQHIIYYRGIMVNQNMKPAAIKFKLTAIRRFYYVAMKYGLVKVNPAIDVHAQRDPDAYLPIIKYLTLEQLQQLFDAIQYTDPLKEARAKAMIALMAIEGLRTVEVHRLNVEDINVLSKQLVILIRGKGHNDPIYPSKFTSDLLRSYLAQRPAPVTALRELTPVFISRGNRGQHRRLSRRSIRREIDEALNLIQAKAPGISCHMLRHTCGTLLYAQTRDIQAVKETLRHKNIEMTSKYSHIQDMALKRYTEAIPIRKKGQ